MNTTYQIVEDGRAIKCLVCGRTSWNRNDVVGLYCGWCCRFHPTAQSHLPIYVVYFNTKDYPDKFVVRRHRIGMGSSVPDRCPVGTYGTLEDARAAVPAGLTRLDRAPCDDPVIVESWI